MAIIADFEVDRTGSALDRVLRRAGVDAELLRSFPLGDRSLIVLRVGGQEADALERAAAADRGAVDPRRMSVAEDTVLYRLAVAETEPLLPGGEWLAADYADGRWSVTARFDSHEVFAEYCEALEADGTEVTIGDLYDRRAGDGLTELQRETLELAYRRGFFEVPRGTTMQELGAALGVSEQAVSQRLRRGYACLVEESLF